MCDDFHHAALRLGVLALACFALTNCDRRSRYEGERLEHTYCAACHIFPQPALLDNHTSLTGGSPQLARPLGMPAKSLFS